MKINVSEIVYQERFFKSSLHKNDELMASIELILEHRSCKSVIFMRSFTADWGFLDSLIFLKNPVKLRFKK